MGKLGKGILIFLFVTNILVLDFFTYKNFQKNQETEVNQTPIVEKSFDSAIDNLSCLDECRNYVDDRVSQLSLTANDITVTQTPTPTTPVTTSTTATTKVKSVSYLPIPGNGNVLSTNWTDVAGTDFYLSKSDYPGLVGVYFEANMKLLNGNGTANLRIYDATHGIGVSGSEINTSSQTSVFVSSGNINLWNGYNNYKVQAKSLTSDTTVFESGRLKIITEN